MLELKEMLDRKERIDLRKEALLKELAYLEDEGTALDTLINVYKTREYDPIEEENCVTEKLTRPKDTRPNITYATLKVAVEEVIRTCGPVGIKDISTLVDRPNSSVNRVVKDFVTEGVVEFIEGFWPRQYVMK